MRDKADEITWIVVADGEKALIFTSEDTLDRPHLKILSKEELDNPPTREQAANRPGRFHDSGAGGAQRSAVADTDWHEFGKEQFEKGFAATLNKAALRSAFDHLLLFAPPHALGNIRGKLHKEAVQRLILAEDKDLTNHSIADIEKHVKRAYLAHRRPNLPPV